MKKKKTVYGILIAVTIVVIVAAVIFFVKPTKNDAETTSAPITEINDLTQTTIATVTEETVTNSSVTVNKRPSKKPSNNAKPVTPDEKLVIDEWLEIESVGEYGGKLCFKVKNISKEDVEFALISCDTGSVRATFRLTALLSGKEALIICNDNIKYDKKAEYKNWKIENKALYLDKRSLHSDAIEINAKNGEIEIKNISDKDIDNIIYIIYKRVENGVYIGPETFRARVDGLKKGESKIVNTTRFNKDVHEIIFVEYEK